MICLKVKALFRIFIWLVIAILLTSIFALSMMGQLTNLTKRLGFLRYDDSGYQAGNGVITDYGAITGLDVEWVSGTVSVSVNVDDEVSISESAAKELSDWQHLRYKLADGILYIKYTAPKSYEFWKTAPSKKLSLSLPASLIKNLETVNISSVSGNVELKSLHSKRLDAETVSGKIKIINSIGDIMNLKSVSGNITVDIPSNDGFTLKYSTASGEMKNKIDDLTVQPDGSYVYKSGGYIFTVETDVGSLEITE